MLVGKCLYIFCLQIKGYLGKKIALIRFLKINQIYTSHIPRILIRFITKPNIGIVTFVDILIVRHHIPKIRVSGGVISLQCC